MFIIHHIIKSSIPTIKKIFGIFFFSIKAGKKKAIHSSSKETFAACFKTSQAAHTHRLRSIEWV